MPEASVYKYSDFVLPEYKIRLSWEFRMSPPTINFVVSQDPFQALFSGTIPTTSNSRHRVRPLLRCKVVRHQLFPI
jgi:hypothetical protein